MDEVKEIIDRLKKRIHDNVNERKKLTSLLSKLKSEKEKLVAERTEMLGRIEELENRIKVLELSEGFFTVSGGNKPARDRVNALLWEVDKCLDLMNKY